jgi:single-stranded-DNA-specific exonuclease
VGERHLKLQLDVHGQRVAGIWFGRAEPLPPECELLFALESNTWQGQTEVQLRVVDARF